jgi:hypothetical protein
MNDRVGTMLGCAILVVSLVGIVLWVVGCEYSNHAQIVAGAAGITIGWLALRWWPAQTPPKDL